MHDNQLEDRVRAVLRAEGDALPLTITPEELERRLSLRRRERTGRRASLVAAGVGVVALGSALAMSTGWLRTPDVGVGPSVAPTTSSISTDAAGACDPLDLATMDRPPSLFMSEVQAGANAVGGQRSAYRLGDRQVGEEGTWEHDTIGIEPVLAGYPSERLQVVIENPGACLVGLRVHAKPTHDMGDAATSIADLTTAPTRGIEFEKLPPGDWFVQVHADFATVSGASAWAEAFFSVLVPDCTPIDPTAVPSPPTVRAGVPFESVVFGGEQVAYEWGGRLFGIAGSTDNLPRDLDPIVVVDPFWAVQLVADVCLIDVSVEAIRVDEAGAPVPGESASTLPIVRGSGTKAIDIGPLPVGHWALRASVGYLTIDRGPAWSETVFRVDVRFGAPGLTLGPDFFEVYGEASCTTYELRSGASSADPCAAAYKLVEGRDPIAVRPGDSIEFRLSDGWQIDEAMVRAVDAELVQAGEFAPEYSVVFLENVGATIGFPVTLDPGSWILRISLTATRQGDTFSAHFDVAVNVGDSQAAAMPTVQTNGSPTLELLNVAVGECLRETNVLTVGPDLGSADVAIDAIDGAHGWIETSTDLGPISYWHGDVTSAAVAFDGVRLATGPGSPWILRADGTARELRSATTPLGRTIWRTGDSAAKVPCAPDS